MLKPIPTTPEHAAGLLAKGKRIALCIGHGYEERFIARVRAIVPNAVQRSKQTIKGFAVVVLEQRKPRREARQKPQSLAPGGARARD